MDWHMWQSQFRHRKIVLAILRCEAPQQDMELQRCTLKGSRANLPEGAAECFKSLNELVHLCSATTGDDVVSVPCEINTQ